MPKFLKKFDCEDICTWIDKVPQQAGFFTFPPFFKGGYEKMWKSIDEIFVWDKPQFNEIGEEQIDELLKKISSRDYFIFGTDREIEGYEEYLHGVSQTSMRGKRVYLYARTGKSYVALPNVRQTDVLIDKLGKDEDIGDDIKLISLKNTEFTALRSKYLNPHIAPAQASLMVGVTVGGKLIGVYAVNPESYDMSMHLQTPAAYMLTDFPIRPTKYKHLAKLVLYAALSKESQFLVEGMLNKRCRSLITTAFTEKPISMKYRGVLKLLSKKTDGEKNVLNYGAEIGDWSLEEGFNIWKSKYGQINEAAK